MKTKGMQRVWRHFRRGEEKREQRQREDTGRGSPRAFGRAEGGQRRWWSSMQNGVRGMGGQEQRAKWVGPVAQGWQQRQIKEVNKDNIGTKMYISCIDYNTIDTATIHTSILAV